MKRKIDRTGRPDAAGWLADLKEGFLVDPRGDFYGGIMAAVVALPLALAFALASGMDARHGLYTAIIAGLVAGIFGGSKVQITGPTGAMAVILAGIVAQYGVDKLWVAAIMAGVIQIALGLFRLGNMIVYVPHPVITGFTSGIAVIILAGQIPNALGLSAGTGEPVHFFERLASIFGRLPDANLVALGLTGFVIAVMRLTPVWITRRIPASLLGLTGATALTALLGLDVPMIGPIPNTLPAPHLPNFEWGDLQHLIRPAIALAMLGAIESLLSAVVADSMSVSERHDSNRELIGQGLANVVTPLFQGIPATGAIARTAVNIRSGGKSRLSSVVHSLSLMIILFFFAGPAAHIPLAALAGILIMTSIRMVEWENTRAILRAPKADRIVLFLTFGVTVAFDLVLAVEIGLVAAGILFIRRMSELGMLNQSVEEIVRSPARARAMAVCPYVVVLEVGGPIFFGAAEKFVNEIKKRIDMRVLILRLRRVNMIDATGAMAFRAILQHCERIGAKIYLSGLQPAARFVLTQMGLMMALPERRIFDHTDEAIVAAEERMANEVCLGCRHFTSGRCALLPDAPPSPG